MEQIDTFSELWIEFDTGQIPPPFCYKYKIFIEKKEKGKFKINLKLEYYDREEITEEEILDEGFSLHDDFSWQGMLPVVWGKELINKLNSTNWRKKPVPGADGSEFLMKIKLLNHNVVLQPAETKSWENFTQEIIQAVFELGEKEAPLSISFQNITSNHIINKVDFEFSFAHRTVRMKTKNASVKTLDWETGQKLMRYIYNIDYYPEHGTENLPQKPGNYISPGDGLWYELNTEKLTGDQLLKTKKLTDHLLNYIK